MDSNIITYLACICFLFIFGRVFIVPITKILKLVINSVLGAILIYIINMVGSGFGFHIGLNFFTSILVRNLRYTWSYLYYNYKIVNRIKIRSTVPGLIDRSIKPGTVDRIIYSTVTDLAKFLGLSTSNPFSFAI